jgi:hypothetical protein
MPIVETSSPLPKGHNPRHQSRRPRRTISLGQPRDNLSEDRVEPGRSGRLHRRYLSRAGSGCAPWYADKADKALGVRAGHAPSRHSRNARRCSSAGCVMWRRVAEHLLDPRPPAGHLQHSRRRFWAQAARQVQRRAQIADISRSTPESWQSESPRRRPRFATSSRPEPLGDPRCARQNRRRVTENRRPPACIFREHVVCSAIFF